MAKIEELLAELKDLDPETYQILTKKIGENVIIFDPWGEKIFGFILQGLLQEAAAARGLAIVIEYPVKDSDWWGAEIREKSSGLSRIRIGPNAAEAILAAYVALLEARR